MDELLRNLANDQMLIGTIESGFNMVFMGICGYFAFKLKYISKKSEDRQVENMKIAQSNKRSSLRGEYLSIFNSDNFTWEEKYSMTREIISEYFELNGNHYIHALEEIMKEKLDEELEEKVNEIE